MRFLRKQKKQRNSVFLVILNRKTVISHIMEITVFYVRCLLEHSRMARVCAFEHTFIF